MASDCRIGFRLNLFNVLILKVLLTHVFLLSSHRHHAHSAQLFDLCEKVYNCTCSKLDYSTVIECPNDQLYESHPITAKVHVFNGTGVLELICVYEKPHFHWRMINGLDFRRNNQEYVITTVAITHCPIPPENDGLAKLLSHLDLDPGHVTTYKYVSRRQLSTFPDYMLEPLANLTVLDLSQNMLTSVPNLSHVPNLRVLEIHSNLITSLPAGTFFNNKQLQRVALRSNSLTTIQDGSLPDSLELLDLVNNRISSLTRNTLSNLSRLRRLYLNKNPLEELDEYAFINLTQLGELRMDRSTFKTFPILNSLQALENVSMSHNLYYQSISKSQQSVVMVMMPNSTTAPTDEDNAGSSMMLSRSVPEDIEEDDGGNISYDVLNNATTANDAKTNWKGTEMKDLPILSYLAMSNDGLTAFPQLENLPNLTNLVLSQNRIPLIPPDALAKLSKLERLDLSQNQIDDVPILDVLTLVSLDLSRNLLSQLRKSTLQLSNLENLNLASNKISYIDPKAFEQLLKLKDLNLSNNLISFVPPADGPMTDPAYSIVGYSPLRFCTKLEQINLSHNLITSMTEDMRTALLYLTKLNLSHNKLATLRTVDLNFLQSKLDLDLSHNEITLVDMKYFNLLISSVGNKIFVKLGGNPLNCDCDAYAFKTLASDYATFHLDGLNCAGPIYPRNLTDLSFQTVPKEDLTCVMDENYGCPEDCTCWRRPADYTVYIDCAHRFVADNVTLPNVTTVALKYGDPNKYGIVLNLADNEITHIPDDYLSEIPEDVRMVDLRRNRLRSVSFLKAMGENNVTRFNLSENPFPCYDCTFHTDSRSQFSRIGDSENLTCRVDSTQIQKALDFDYESVCSVHLVGVIAPVVVVALLLVAVSVVCVRNGWAIRAYLYSKGYGFLLCDKYFEDDEEKLYDAFVSYSNVDESWVLEELVKRLEGQEGFKLCLHFRDWTPGEWIPDQIIRSVDQSRRTVVVLSKNFVDSMWSKLEFKAAHKQALKDRSNRLILVLMGEDLTEKDVKDDDLRVYMKMNTYIKWNDPWFWHKLKYALPHRKCSVEENRNHYIKRVQRERAIQLDKIRTKMESQVPA